MTWADAPQRTCTVGIEKVENVCLLPRNIANNKVIKCYNIKTDTRQKMFCQIAEGHLNLIGNEKKQRTGSYYF